MVLESDFCNDAGVSSAGSGVGVGVGAGAVTASDACTGSAAGVGFVSSC